MNRKQLADESANRKLVTHYLASRSFNAVPDAIRDSIAYHDEKDSPDA